MPSIVLRNPNLPGQPVVVDVPAGSYIPDLYRDGGFVIDPDTTVADALVEADRTRAAATLLTSAEDAVYVPQFAPAETPEPEPESQPDPPAEPDQPEAVPAVLDLSKE